MSTWKTLLTQHDQLKKKASATLFERVKILAKVFADKSYVSEMQRQGKPVTELLDVRVSDSCANFTELLQILKKFPRKNQWERGNLYEMRAEMLDSIRSKQVAQRNGKAPAKKERQPKRTATIAEVRDMKDELKEKTHEIVALKALESEKDRSIRQLEQALESARQTIGSLNETISLQRMRINEIEARLKEAGLSLV